GAAHLERRFCETGGIGRTGGRFERRDLRAVVASSGRTGVAHARVAVAVIGVDPSLVPADPADERVDRRLAIRFGGDHHLGDRREKRGGGELRLKADATSGEYRGTHPL